MLHDIILLYVFTDVTCIAHDVVEPSQPTSHQSVQSLPGFLSIHVSVGHCNDRHGGWVSD